MGQERAVVRRQHNLIINLIKRYSFEATLIAVQGLVCVIAAISLLAVFTPSRINAQIEKVRGNRNPPQAQATNYRIVKLPEITPQPQIDKNQAGATGMYITVTELQQPPAINSTDATEQLNKQAGDEASVSQIVWPAQPSTSQPIPTPLAETASPLAGLPVKGELSQAFGCSSFYTGIPGPGCSLEQPWFHDGLDIATWTGAPVRAALNGTVIFAGPDGDGPPCGRYRGYGLGVVVDSGAGWQTLYAHLSDIQVTAGQTVGPDTVIGTVGETGCVTGAHLHFALRHHGELVDPMRQFQKNRHPGRRDE